MKDFNKIESFDEYESFFETLLKYPELAESINLAKLWTHYFDLYVNDFYEVEHEKAYNAATFFTKNRSKIPRFKDFIQLMFNKCLEANSIEFLNETRVPHLSLFLYEKDLEEYCYVINTESDSQKLIEEKDDHRMLTVFNQDGYDTWLSRNPITVPHAKGSPLLLDDDTPIGYNIHLPHGEIKGIMITAYGGGEINKESKMYQPHTVSDLEKTLLEQGIVQITLNLADIIKLKDYQLEMPDEIHELLHESINKFFTQIKTQPEQLEPSLTVLKNLPIYLYGASFGGRTAIKHAERFPKTFDGYISFNGALSFDMMEKSDLPKIAKRTLKSNKATLCPTYGIENIQDPVLLLHNMDDNNVNVKVTLDWYKKAKNAGISDLVHLQFPEKGGRPAQRTIETLGHKMPKDEKSFNLVSDSISSFITKSKDLITVTKWKYGRHKLLANKNYRSATLDEKFISFVYALDRAERINLLSDTEKFSELYYVFYYIDSLRRNIYSNLLIRDASLEDARNGYAIHSKDLAKFVKEKYPEIPVSGVNFEDDSFIEKYHTAIQTGKIQEKNINRDAQLKLLFSFYFGNKHLLQSEFALYKQNESIQSNLVQVREKLNKKIKKERVLIANVWRDVSSQARKLQHKESRHSEPASSQIESAISSIETSHIGPSSSSQSEPSSEEDGSSPQTRKEKP